MFVCSLGNVCVIIVTVCVAVLCCSTEESPSDQEVWDTEERTDSLCSHPGRDDQETLPGQRRVVY